MSISPRENGKISNKYSVALLALGKISTFDAKNFARECPFCEVPLRTEKKLKLLLKEESLFLYKWSCKDVISRKSIRSNYLLEETKRIFASRQLFFNLSKLET